MGKTERKTSRSVAGIQAATGAVFSSLAVALSWVRLSDAQLYHRKFRMRLESHQDTYTEKHATRLFQINGRLGSDYGTQTQTKNTHVGFIVEICVDIG